MVNKRICIVLSLIFSSINMYANDSNIDYHTPYYSRVEFGGTFSRCVDMQIDHSIWDIINEGYNSNLGRAPFFGFATGFNLGCWLSLGANYTYRGPLSYCKKQSPTAAIDSLINTLEVDRTRFFDLENNSFMIELFANRMGFASAYTYDIFSGTLAPYLGFGLGWSRNIVSNFHSVLDKTASVQSFVTNEVASVMTYKATKDFSWHFNLGLEYNLDYLALGIGYRYFDGGKFASNNYLVDNLEGVFNNQEIQLPSWKGKFTSNEFVVSLSLNF